jgi:hypothetical protein
MKNDFREKDGVDGRRRCYMKNILEKTSTMSSIMVITQTFIILLRGSLNNPFVLQSNMYFS